MGASESIAGGLGTGGQRGGGSFLDFSSPDQQPETTTSFVVLFLGSENFAIEIGKVREIIRVPQLTWLPGVPAQIKGVINMRGSVMPVIDLPVLLSLPASSGSEESRIVIVEAAGCIAGLMVDGVQGVADARGDRMQPAMRTLSESQRSCLSGQMDIDGTLVGVLDAERLLEQARPSAKNNRFSIRGL